ncbi:isoquinoline 1-oxidoreductase [Burkholderia multivorans CGD2M]|uniref:Isoquinoline 1-oxidoreductase n=2 Tax=Burkholderia multivorans TaxID=87883 RepID=B9BNS4_9BURK|nr:isoquinoline 1-oxidoreductase [Burkholderia multivorans CGD2]EEE13613.1 isoquinoline 1-oxidoreductase [Burkholderia multivorans CGD2M]
MPAFARPSSLPCGRINMRVPDDFMERGFSRRDFLRLGISVGVCAGGGLLLSVSFGAPTGQRPSLAGERDTDTINRGQFAPNAFIRIDKSGEVTLVIPKVEMGQGVYTSLSMLLAEELEVSLNAVKLQHAPPNAALYADPILQIQATGGSMSVRAFWEPLRRAGAVARQLLIRAAAKTWSVEPSSCSATEGVVNHSASGRKLAYSALVEKAALLPVSDSFVKSVTLKNPASFKLIGRPVKRLDSPDKVDGTARYGIDTRLPGMVYAVVVHSPVFGGSVVSVDDRAARTVPGVRQVVKLDNAVAVIGTHTWAAKRGANALVIHWNAGTNAGLTTEMLVDDLRRASTKQGAVAKKAGDVVTGLERGKKRLDAVYEQPFLAHATMEPMNCTVHVHDGICEIWAGTQVPTRATDIAAQATGLPPDRVLLHNFLLGGGFGRRLEVDFIGEAVRIGRQVDAPVKVIWTREEDIQHDMFRPYYLDRMSAALGADGKPVAWTHRITGSSIAARWAPQWVKDGVDLDAVDVAASLPYDIPAQLVDYVRQEPRGVPTAFWRGVGALRGTFVVESFIDELANLAGADPVAYRRNLLDKSPRALHVLDIAARTSGWGTPMPKGKGRGVSLMNAFGSYFCMVAEVDVQDGDVRVERVVCAVDCGHVINPNTVEAQMEGGIIFGIAAALWGEVTLKDGRVQQGNFNDYRVMRINEAPRIETIIVPSGEAPGGIGEPGTANIVSAVTNAVFAATGQRVRRLPIGRQLKAAESA